MHASFSKEKFQDGFTLLELMVVVSIIGILASVAVPQFSKYMKRSKSAEAPLNLRKVYDGQMAYYYQDHTDAAGNNLSKDFVWLPTVPAWPPTEQKRHGDFEAFNWPLIQFSTDGPVFYVYSTWVYPVQGPPAPKTPPGLNPPPSIVDAFAARAQGDLDGDGEFSFYERVAFIEPSENGGEPTGFPGVFSLDPLE